MRMSLAMDEWQRLHNTKSPYYSGDNHVFILLTLLSETLP